MKKRFFSSLFCFYFLSVNTNASSLTEPGAKTVVEFGNTSCTVVAKGKKVPDSLPTSFQIDLICGAKNQTLWVWDGQLWDEPKLELLSSGDFDGDAKIDLELELSPKYSMSKRVLFLSKEAAKDEIVGAAYYGKEIDKFFRKSREKTASKEKPRAKYPEEIRREDLFTKTRKCLESKNAKCLTDMIIPAVYFPDYQEYGCKLKKATIADPNNNRTLIAASDFATCIVTSYELFNFFEECFSDDEVELGGWGNDLSIEIEGGTCSVERVGDKYLIAGFSKGC